MSEWDEIKKLTTKSVGPWYFAFQQLILTCGVWGIGTRDLIWTWDFRLRLVNNKVSVFIPFGLKWINCSEKEVISFFVRQKMNVSFLLKHDNFLWNTNKTILPNLLTVTSIWIVSFQMKAAFGYLWLRKDMMKRSLNLDYLFNLQEKIIIQNSLEEFGFSDWRVLLNFWAPVRAKKQDKKNLKQFDMIWWKSIFAQTEKLHVWFNLLNIIFNKVCFRSHLIL